MHAVYPGSFDPVTAGHLDIIRRARELFARVTVFVAINNEKRSASTQAERILQVQGQLAPGWGNVAVAAWSGLTVQFCLEHDADVIIRGVRNQSDLRHEYQLAVLNQDMSVTTLLMSAQPELVAMSSTLVRGLAASRLSPGHIGGTSARDLPRDAENH